jgi:hypothetical protein
MSQGIAASIHQRMLNYARSRGHLFNEVLQYYALERFLYRVGHSSYRDRFVLKGALMLAAWQSPTTRPTRDIDLLGQIDSAVDQVALAIGEICQESVHPDGLRFDAESIAGERIIEAANYAGVRVRFTGYLGTAKIPMQIDVGFGDPLVPGPVPVFLPTILDLPPPEVQGYSRESAIAEKYQTMVYLGEINSRMKDFYDIWLLATQFSFDGPILAQAIHETFCWRQTALLVAPVAFTDAFAKSSQKGQQWAAFTSRHHLNDVSVDLYETIQMISAFLLPVSETLSDDRPFDRHWSPGGPWR